MRKTDFEHLKDKPDLIKELLEDKTSYGETFFVPVRARWHEQWIKVEDDSNDGFQKGELVPALKDLKHDVGNMLNKAIAAIEEENDALAGVLKNNIDFNAVKGKTKIPDQKWKDLLDHFNQPQFVLVNDNFEFPDLLGAAYEYLIKFFADSAGKKGGEFYTPAEVVRLLVQITKPEAGNEIYDPTGGSGGFLIQSHQYVEEQGQDSNDLALFGQESNGTVWSICNMNMILHNITRFTIENGDTLEDPLILFFQSEADEIETLEAHISEMQSELAEVVETAQEVAAYEPEEDETVTAAVIKKALKELIEDLKGSTGDSARKELQKLQEQEKTIAAIEKRIKESKVALKTKTDELEHKLQLKRLGGDEFKAESKELIRQVDTQLAKLVSSNKDDKKKITALNKDKATLKERLARTDGILAVIGGQLTEAQAKTLILKKLYDLANTELNRYLNAEKRGLIHVVENLWDKYAVPSRELESERSETLKTLDGFLKGLEYLEPGI
jgi:hypothetical protein